MFKKEVRLETRNNDYDFNLFKPVSPYGRKNKNLILTLLAIWFIAIFGFQLLLIIFQKPTPEKSLIVFESVWNNVKSGQATEQEKKDFINSLVNVAGKSLVKPTDRIIIQNTLTWHVNEMIGESEKMILSEKISELKETKAKLAVAPDEEYSALTQDIAEIKAAINAIANEKTGIDPTNNKEAILPYSINPEFKALSPDEIEALPRIMKFYLTHNQSFLTDMKILGFPFHYFYTSEFLLILFIGLSLFYSIRITRLQKSFSIKEE